MSTYGRWLKKRAPGALDRLDSVQHNYVPAEACGSKVVAEGGYGQTPQTGTTLQPQEITKNSLVPPTRIERATRGLGNRCSIQLSYGGVA